jgi:hypothetical protein
MNEKNFDYLKEDIKYKGFGEKLSEDLEKALRAGAPEFQLTLSTEVNKKPFEAVLNFRKSDNSDLYFFNSYQASLQRSNGEKVEQKFYLNNGKGVTAKEAYNLLEGRAVHKELATKEGATYKAWIQLDFDKKDKNNNHEVKQYHEAYGYDLKAALSKYPISEMEKGEEKALLQSLQKGNIQAITMDKDGVSTKMFVEANPQYKTVTLYDNNLRMLGKDQRQAYEKAQGQGQSVSLDLKPEQKQGEKVRASKAKAVKEGPAQKPSKRKVKVG